MKEKKRSTYPALFSTYLPNLDGGGKGTEGLGVSIGKEAQDAKIAGTDLLRD